MEEEERREFIALYAIMMADRSKYKKVIDNIDMVLARMRKELCIEV